jgi:hypothetical protein
VAYLLSSSDLGELCGSVFVDQRFEKYIRRRIGDREINRMKPRTKNEMMTSWEQKVKFKFGNVASGMEGYEVHVLGLPDSMEKAIEEGFHSIETYVIPPFCYYMCIMGYNGR